jgi:hypothetical protein
LGAAYLLGQAAKAGDEAALDALECMLRTEDDTRKHQLALPWRFKFERVMPVGLTAVPQSALGTASRAARGGKPDDGEFAEVPEIVVGTHGDRVLSQHRAAVWGLVAAADAAVPRLLPLLMRHDEPLLVLRAAWAFGHAVEASCTVTLVDAVATAMAHQRSALESSPRHGTEQDTQAYEIAQRREWRRTVFASPAFMERSRQPAWMAFEALAQALWGLARTALRCQAVASCVACAQLALLYCKPSLDLPPRVRMNATYTLLSLATGGWGADAELEHAMVSQLSVLALDDDDRYVCAAAIEGVRRIAARGQPQEMVSKMRKLAESRFCRISSTSTPW